MGLPFGDVAVCCQWNTECPVGGGGSVGGGLATLLRMRVMVNFTLRDCWSVHCVSEDALTCISPTHLVPDQPTLIRLLRYVGATYAELKKVDERIREWGRGSVFVTLAPGRRNLLRIRPPWSDDLKSADGEEARAQRPN